MSETLLPLKLFISRRTEDAHIAEFVSGKLTEACSSEDRLKIYHAEHIAGGDLWKRWINDRVHDANCFLLIFRGPPEKWLTYELAKFEEDPRKERVLAIHPPGSRPDWLDDRQCTEARPELLKRLFAEIIVDGTPPEVAADQFARFVPLNENWGDAELDEMVSGFLDLFGTQEQVIYPLMMRLDLTVDRPEPAADERTPSEATGCVLIGDDARVSSVGRENCLKLFNRGQAPDCSWVDLTAWHRSGDGANDGAVDGSQSVEQPPSGDAEGRPPAPIGAAWIEEVDRALRQVEAQQNLRQPRRALRSYEGGSIYLPVIATSRLTRLRDRVEIDSVDIALVEQPRPTAASGRRFRLLELVERVHTEVVAPVSRRSADLGRFASMSNAMALIRSEHPDDEIVERASDLSGEIDIAEELRAMYASHDALRVAVDDGDEEAAADALDRLGRHCLEAWRSIVDEYASFVAALDPSSVGR